jgi:hypothetical protein
MNTLRIASLAAAILLAAGACNDDDGTGPSPSALAGTWNATKFEYVEVANPANKIDVIPLGGTLTVVLTGAGAFTAASTFPGEAPFNAAGTWSASADVFTLNFTSGMSGTQQFDFSLSGNTLTLNGADAEFDFDDDDVDDPAKLNLVLVRNP